MGERHCGVYLGVELIGGNLETIADGAGVVAAELLVLIVDVQGVAPIAALDYPHELANGPLTRLHLDVEALKAGNDLPIRKGVIFARHG